MIKRYKWKCRILLLKTPNYKDINYLKAKNIYQKNIKGFHKRIVKISSMLRKNHKFEIDLVGFDGLKKDNFKSLDSEKIFRILDKMPLGKILKNKKIKPLNLSLFSDYNPKTTTHGLGFKDKDKALYTIRKIRKRNKKYQINVIATMLGRAKKHPYKTKQMKEAIKVFSVWMKNYKKSKAKS